MANNSLLTTDAQALLEQLKEFDPRKLTDEVVSLGEQWAMADAGANDLEENKKTLLARITLEYVADSQRSAAGLGTDKPKIISMAQAELRALADPRYETHLDMMVAARREAQIFRVRYDMGRMRLELMRSLQATMRNEMRMTGLT